MNNKLIKMEADLKRRHERLTNSLFGCKQGSFRSRLNKVNRPTKKTVVIKTTQHGKEFIPEARRMVVLGDDMNRFIYISKKES